MNRREKERTHLTTWMLAADRTQSAEGNEDDGDRLHEETIGEGWIPRLRGLPLSLTSRQRQ